MIEGLRRFHRDWAKVTDFVGSRSAAQVRSHAQKYFDRLARENSDEWVPAARPKRRSAAPYPRKATVGTPTPAMTPPVPTVTTPLLGEFGVGLMPPQAQMSPFSPDVSAGQQAGMTGHAGMLQMWQAQATHMAQLNAHAHASAHGQAFLAEANQASMQNPGVPAHVRKATAQAQAQAIYTRAFNQYLTYCGASMPGVAGGAPAPPIAAPQAQAQPQPSTPNFMTAGPNGQGFLVSSPIAYDGSMHPGAHSMSPHLLQASPAFSNATTVGGMPHGMHPGVHPSMSPFSMMPHGYPSASSPFLPSPFGVPSLHPQMDAAGTQMCPHGNHADPGGCRKCLALQRHGNVLTNLYGPETVSSGRDVESCPSGQERAEHPSSAEDRPVSPARISAVRRTPEVAPASSDSVSGSGSGEADSGAGSSGNAASCEDSSEDRRRIAMSARSPTEKSDRASAAKRRTHRAKVVRSRKTNREIRSNLPPRNGDVYCKTVGSKRSCPPATPFTEVGKPKRPKASASGGEEKKQAEIDAVRTLQILSNSPTSADETRK